MISWKLLYVMSSLFIVSLASWNMLLPPAQQQGTLTEFLSSNTPLTVELKGGGRKDPNQDYEFPVGSYITLMTTVPVMWCEWTCGGEHIGSFNQVLTSSSAVFYEAGEQRISIGGEMNFGFFSTGVYVINAGCDVDGEIVRTATSTITITAPSIANLRKLNNPIHKLWEDEDDLKLGLIDLTNPDPDLIAGPVFNAAITSPYGGTAGFIQTVQSTSTFSGNKPTLIYTTPKDQVLLDAATPTDTMIYTEFDLAPGVTTIVALKDTPHQPVDKNDYMDYNLYKVDFQAYSYLAFIPDAEELGITGSFIVYNTGPYYSWSYSATGGWDGASQSWQLRGGKEQFTNFAAQGQWTYAAWDAAAYQFDPPSPPLNKTNR